NVDMIVQNVSRSGITDISFTLPKDDLKKAGKVIDGLLADLGATGYDEDAGIARVSLIGAGMKSHPGVAATMFEVLAREGVNIESWRSPEARWGARCSGRDASTGWTSWWSTSTTRWLSSGCPRPPGPGRGWSTTPPPSGWTPTCRWSWPR